MSAQKEFANYLKRKRVEAGVTQADVSRKLGYANPQFVSNWERGMAQLPLAAVTKLIKLYRINPDEIVLYYIKSAKEQLNKALRVTKSR